MISRHRGRCVLSEEEAQHIAPDLAPAALAHLLDRSGARTGEQEAEMIAALIHQRVRVRPGLQKAEAEVPASPIMSIVTKVTDAPPTSESYTVEITVPGAVQPHSTAVVVPVFDTAISAFHLLINLLVPSVRAFVRPVVRKTSIAGHQVWIVSARVVS